MAPQARPPCGRAYYMRFKRAQWKKELKRIETVLNGDVYNQRRISVSAQDMLVIERDRLRQRLGRKPKIPVQQADTSVSESVGDVDASGSIISNGKVQLTLFMHCIHSPPLLLTWNFFKKQCQLHDPKEAGSRCFLEKFCDRAFNISF